MCCSLLPADFSSTIVYAGEALHPTLKRVVHVLGYKNEAEDLSGGPNAMILPFPAAEPMGPMNAIGPDYAADDLRAAFEGYRKALEPDRLRSRGLKSYAAAAGSPEVQVFDAGSYTVVMAGDAVGLYKGLQQVRESRRPTLDRKFLQSYRKLYPGWTLVLCCWDGRLEADPMLWWYEPKHPDVLFAPTLDAHDGRPPDPDAEVYLDHAIVFGSTIRPEGRRIVDAVKNYLSIWLPDKVVGRIYPRRGAGLGNGDFALRWNDVRGPSISHEDWRRMRVVPPGAPRAAEQGVWTEGVTT